MDHKTSSIASLLLLQMQHSHRPKRCILSVLLPVFLIVLSQVAAAEALPAYAAGPGGVTHYHTFVVETAKVKRLCVAHNIITVNGTLPGPTLTVRTGDALVINVVNRANENVTIHWHGIRQLLTAWADGPEFITQCPIRPGGSYTYRYRVIGQEGTLWWHAHSSWLRATVYGAIVIHPKEGRTYPFAPERPPQREYTVLLGEWWNTNPLEIVRRAVRTGTAPNVSDAFTINGQPGDLYNCSSKGTTIFPVSFGETVLLRVINAALNQELFFSVAGHRMTVVSADATYKKPFTTSYLMLGPGQTTDVLITANQPPARYYMAARAYTSAPGVPFDNTTTTAILEYVQAAAPAAAPAPMQHPATGGQQLSQPVFPALPDFNDTASATVFSTSFRSARLMAVPNKVDLNLFFTVGLGLVNGRNNTLQIGASMNNHSFVLPSNFSILQAHLQNIPGVFTPNFPPTPPFRFNYTDPNVPTALWQAVRGTEVLKVKFGSVVNLVLQGTSIVGVENHPMHLHGYDFYVLGMGFGNFDTARDTARLNFHDPPVRNTVGVPAGGWAVIRFVANNPGAWIMHCHLDVHLTWGLAMVFVVENGVGEKQTLPPPPADLPTC